MTPCHMDCHNKIPYLDGINKKIYFLTVLEAEKSKIKILAYCVPDESSFHSLLMATFLLCPHMVFPLFLCM